MSTRARKGLEKMAEDQSNDQLNITFLSARFGELTVPSDSVIEFPLGLIGFPNYRRFVLLEHRSPFSWLHSIDEPALAFVVVDGFEQSQFYNLSSPFSVKECDFCDTDEYAILIIVTVRPDPNQTTANVKAPLFINVRNRKGVQVIYDDSALSTRHPLWVTPEAEQQEGEQTGAEQESESDVTIEATSENPSNSAPDTQQD